MKIKTGSIKLDELLNECEYIIDKTMQLEKYSKSIIFEKVKSQFVDTILKRHFTFYVKKDVLDDSKNIEDNFTFYSKKIFATEDIYYLLFLKNLTDFDKKKYSVSWIIIETDIDIKKSIEIKELIFLDYFLEKNKINEKGLIDFDLYESILFSTNNNIRNEFLKKPNKTFISNLFNLKLNKKNYAPKRFHYYENVNDIEIKKNMANYVYVFYCPLCSLQHNIYLNGHKNANVNNYIAIDESKNKIIFECKHDSSEIESKIKLGFKREMLKGELKNDESFNKSFLYFYYSFKYNNKQSFYCCEKGNKLTESQISKYIEVY